MKVQRLLLAAQGAAGWFEVVLLGVLPGMWVVILTVLAVVRMLGQREQQEEDQPSQAEHTVEWVIAEEEEG
jgi:hypothetical protein